MNLQHFRRSQNPGRDVAGVQAANSEHELEATLKPLYFCKWLNEKRLGLVDGGAGALSYNFASVLVEGAGLGDGIDGFLDLGIGFK
jgi:hypothetical protein